MVEAIEGSLNLMKLGFTGGLLPFRTLKEVSQVRRAREAGNQLRRSQARLMVAKRKDMADYIREHKDGLQHAVDSVGFLYELIKNCAYDIHIIKGIIRKMRAEDLELKKEGLSPKTADHLEKAVMETLQKINVHLRKDSDILGALIKE